MEHAEDRFCLEPDVIHFPNEESSSKQSDELVTPKGEKEAVKKVG